MYVLKSSQNGNKNLSLFGFPETFSCVTFNRAIHNYVTNRNFNSGYWERSNDEQDSSLEKVTQHKDPLRKIMIILYKHQILWWLEFRGIRGYLLFTN